MRIVIVNAKYSRNLGDGVLAECLEAQILKRLPYAKITAVDIGGSDFYSENNNNSLTPKYLSKTLKFFPKPLLLIFKIMLRNFLLKKKFSKKWKSVFYEADLIILGGGHLFMDVDCYFPMRIRHILSYAKKDIPLIVYGVGVSKKISKLGLRYFYRMLQSRHLLYISVRDKKSLENWKYHFPLYNAHISLDPAFLCSETYEIISGYTDYNLSKKQIAVCISDLSNIITHSDSKELVVGRDILFFVRLADLLSKNGFDLVFFNNGADSSTMIEVVDIINEKFPTIKFSVLKTANTPHELIEQISSFRVLISHRLHSCIIAFSLGLECVGLMGDEKIASFFKIINKDNLLIKNENINEMLQIVNYAFTEYKDDRNRSSILKQCEKDIDLLCNTISDFKKSLN